MNGSNVSAASDDFEITIDTALTKGKYVKLNLLLLAKHPVSYVWLFLWAVQILFSATGMSWWWPIGFFFLLVFVYGAGIASMTLSSKNSSFFTAIHYVFRNDNVYITTSDSQSKLNWSRFVEWRYIGGDYLLFLSRTSFYLIPKESIRTDYITLFEEMLNKHILGKKQRKKGSPLAVGILIFLIILSLAWLFTILGSYTWGNTILTDVGGGVITVIAVVPILFLTFEYWALFRRNTKLKLNRIALWCLFILTSLAMILVILDVFVFFTFMY